MAAVESEESVITIDGRASRELMAMIALGSLRGVVEFIKARCESAAGTEPVPPPLLAAPTEADREVMTADEVAAFLGVDRNTVYDYAGRGVIPHQRLGKRILFRRGALVSWLDTSCKATSTRKG
ncbi:MAG: helix-turn-helix domain-containing protein [Kofleriaceae bacterium]